MSEEQQKDHELYLKIRIIIPIILIIIVIINSECAIAGYAYKLLLTNPL
jgi:hypothetical protein